MSKLHSVCIKNHYLPFILLLTYFLFSLFLASFISLFNSIHFQVILEMCTKPIWGQNWPQSLPKVLQSKLAKWLCLKNTRKSFYKRYSFIQFSLFFIDLMLIFSFILGPNFKAIWSSKYCQVYWDLCAKTTYHDCHGIGTWRIIADLFEK